MLYEVITGRAPERLEQPRPVHSEPVDRRLVDQCEVPCEEEGREGRDQVREEQDPEEEQERETQQLGGEERTDLRNVPQGAQQLRADQEEDGERRAAGDEERGDPASDRAPLRAPAEGPQELRPQEQRDRPAGREGRRRCETSYNFV